MVKIVEIHTTYPNVTTAENTARLLVKTHLIACANVIAAKSYFEWDQKSQSEAEWLVIMKTMPEKLEQVIAEILSHHPYQLPSITWSEVSTTESYGLWVNDQTTLSAQ